MKHCCKWLTEGIVSFGALFYIEDVSCLDRYEENGMTERTEDAEPEFLNIIRY
ncbi:MAG: hypothetical protein ACI4JB_01910 [Porcipelethomonas sp.]